MFIFALTLISGTYTQAANVGVAYNEEATRVTYQHLYRSDISKFYINSDINNLDTTKVSNVTRLVAHGGLDSLHLSAMGTFSNGYNATMVGIGYDYLDKQLLGFDVGKRNNGDTAVFVYWGIGNRFAVSDGFMDTDGKTYIMRGNLLYLISKTIQAGYEVEIRNDIPIHSFRVKVGF